MDFDETYRTGRAPWEIGGPQPALADVPVKGPRVLDVGCGTGELAIALARRGFDVTGVDFSAVAVDMARAKAAAAGVEVRFEVQDATKLTLPARFDTIVDSGLLHILARDEGGAAGDYLGLLPGLAAPGGLLYVLAVSAESGPGWTVTEDFLRAVFGEPHWTGTRVDRVAVAAVVDGQPFTHPGFLLRTARRG